MPSSWWFLKHGGSLVFNGYRAIPLVPHEKRPGSYSLGRWSGYVDWTRHCSRDTTELEVETWRQWPDAGIGIACGNVVAVDIDVSDATAAESIEQLAMQRLGATPLVRVGMPPKRILVYRVDGEPFHGLKRPPVEVLGLGQQFVAHGFHPVTREAYHWRGAQPADVHVLDLPAVTEDALRAFLELAEELVPPELRPARICGEGLRGALGARTPDELRGTRRAVELALRHVPNSDVPYDDWIRVAHALKGALGESGRDLFLAWSATSSKNVAASSEKAWRSIRLEGLRSGAGSIYRWAMDAGWEAPEDVVLSGRVQELLDLEAEQGHPAQALLDAVDAGMVTSQLSADEPTEARVEVLSGPVTGDALVDALRNGSGPGEASPELLDVDGLVGDLAAWITDTAPVRQPWLALGAALVTVGVLTARRYAGPTGLRGNLQAIVVAPSGAGKEHARAAVLEVLQAAGLDAYLGGAEIASPTGLVSALNAHPAKLYRFDEFGHWLSETIGPRAPTHRRAIGKLITELFSTSMSTYRGIDYADPKAKPCRPLHQPTASFYCTTTGEQLWQAFSSGAAEDGFLARWLLFATELPGAPTSDDEEVGVRPPSEDIKARCVGITQGLIGADYGGDLARVMTGDTCPVVPRIGWSPETQAENCRLKDRVAGLKEEARREGGEHGQRALALFSRIRELTLKVAMVRAIGRAPWDPEMTGTDLSWARGVVEHCQAAMLSALERHVGESDYERHVKRALEGLRRAGEAGMGRGQLTKLLQRVQPNVRDYIYRDVVERGLVVKRREATTTKSAERFYLARRAPKSGGGDPSHDSGNFPGNDSPNRTTP